MMVSNGPVLRRYSPTDQQEVFDLLRASLSAPVSARIIEQWNWKYESNPFNPPEGPIAFVLQVGSKIVSLVAGFRLPAWIAGSACEIENLGEWVVHPEYRRQHIWRKVDNKQLYRSPIAISWGGGLSARIGLRSGWAPTQMNALIRILDLRQLIKHFSGNSAFASFAGSLQSLTRFIAQPFRRVTHSNLNIVCIVGVDERCDELWERSRRDDRAMVIRNRRYLQWRYVDRPDAEYLVLAVENGTELLGMLIARITVSNGIRWGYLVDFWIARTGAEGVFDLLVQEVLEEFRRRGAAGASCYTLDQRFRRTLHQHGFFRAPQRDPTHFSVKVNPNHPDLMPFGKSHRWYITMGDGDLELSS
jgi:hypothetical protein